MLKVKIVNTEDLYLKDEENAINNAIQELFEDSKDCGIFITKLVYRQNSTIIEYELFEESHTHDSMCCAPSQPDEPTVPDCNAKPLE